MGKTMISIAGTRPEAIKLAPLALAAARRGLDHRLIATGQHDAMFEQVVDAFGLTVWPGPGKASRRWPRGWRTRSRG